MREAPLQKAPYLFGQCQQCFFTLKGGGGRISVNLAKMVLGHIFSDESPIFFSLKMVKKIELFHHGARWTGGREEGFKNCLGNGST